MSILLDLDSKVNPITMAEQRVHSAEKPLNRYSPILMGQFSELYCKPAYAYLYNHFSNRQIIYGSYGKDKNGNFSPFFAARKDGKYRKNALIECTHLTFTINYKDKDSKIEQQGFPVLIVDIDDFDGDFSVFSKNNLIPNYFILNPKKATSLQVGYVLNNPVFKEKRKDFLDYRTFKADLCTEEAEQPPQVKFIRTVDAMNHLFNGDRNFKLHNAKNPFFATEVGAIAWTDEYIFSIDELHERATIAEKRLLDELNGNVQEKTILTVDFSDIQNHIQTETDPNEHYIFSKDSRNCTLFDRLRLDAYELSKEYIETNAAREFYQYLFEIATSANAEGVPINEVKAMVRSIVKYCFRNKVACKYPSYQKRRLDKMSEVKNYMMKKYGVNHRYSRAERKQLAELYGVAERTITVYASMIRKEFGTPDDEKTRLWKEIDALRNTIPPIKWARIAEMLNLSEDNVKKIYKRNKVEN